MEINKRRHNRANANSGFLCWRGFIGETLTSIVLSFSSDEITGFSELLTSRPLWHTPLTLMVQHQPLVLWTKVTVYSAPTWTVHICSALICSQVWIHALHERRRSPWPACTYWAGPLMDAHMKTLFLWATQSGSDPDLSSSSWSWGFEPVSSALWELIHSILVNYSEILIYLLAVA